MQADGALLAREEKTAIEEKMTDLRQHLAGKDHRAIKQAAEALSRATDDFAARRMDAGIRRALAGRKIGSL
jgi:molecular chaperone HscA